MLVLFQQKAQFTQSFLPHTSSTTAGRWVESPASIFLSSKHLSASAMPHELFTIGQNPNIAVFMCSDLILCANTQKQTIDDEKKK